MQWVLHRKLTSVDELFESLRTICNDDYDELQQQQVQADIWNMILKSPYKSSPLAALPKTYDGAIRAMNVGITQTEEEQAIRSLEYRTTWQMPRSYPTKEFDYITCWKRCLCYTIFTKGGSCIVCSTDTYPR